MRAVAFAWAALSCVAAVPAGAQSQSYGPPDDGYQSGPPSYFTDRPPARGSEPNFDRPPMQRGEQSPQWPQPGQSMGPRPQSDERIIRDARPRPPNDNSFERPPAPTYRRAGPGPGPGPEMSARPGDNRGGERRVYVTPNAPQPRGPAPRERYSDNGPSGSGSRVMIGPNEMVISISEYEELKDQARELQRLRGTRTDQRDYRQGSGPTYR